MANYLVSAPSAITTKRLPEVQQSISKVVLNDGIINDVKFVPGCRNFESQARVFSSWGLHILVESADLKKDGASVRTARSHKIQDAAIVHSEGIEDVVILEVTAKHIRAKCSNPTSNPSDVTGCIGEIATESFDPGDINNDIIIREQDDFVPSS